MTAVAFLTVLRRKVGLTVNLLLVDSVLSAISE